MAIAKIIVLIAVGFLPSLLWLRFYLAKDCHQEPKGLILKTFFLGMLLAPLAVAAQWLFGYIVTRYAPGYPINDSSAFFLWAAFVEEVVKFLAVYYLVIHNSEFDEPIDAMLYLVTAALGFAALENILVLFKNIPDGVTITAQVLVLRFFGATLLHTLSSGLVGYFLALSWFYHHHSRKFLWFGIAVATLFHFLFNILLLNFSPTNGFLASSGLLVIMLFLVSILFTKVSDRSPSRLSTVPPS